MNSHIQSILTLVAAHYGITIPEILAREKYKHVMEARQVAMWLCRGRLDMSYPELGIAFDRDHATLLRAVRKMDGATGRTLQNIGVLWEAVVKATPELDRTFTVGEWVAA